jgi:hypothetical protein
MSPDDWITCPEGCDTGERVALVDGNRIGFSCIECGRQIEFKAPMIEAQYAEVKR